MRKQTTHNDGGEGSVQQQLKKVKVRHAHQCVAYCSNKRQRHGVGDVCGHQFLRLHAKWVKKHQYQRAYGTCANRGQRNTGPEQCAKHCGCRGLQSLEHLRLIDT